ncbi:MAG: hypothetical protein ABUT20_36180, partial [Bacteroidota bacterium]
MAMGAWLFVSGAAGLIHSFYKAPDP